MKRFNCLIKITGCVILLVSMVSAITSCEDNSGSTYLDSNGQNTEHAMNMTKVPGKEGILSKKTQGMKNVGSIQNTPEGFQLSNSKTEISMLPRGWEFMISPLINTDDYIELHFKSTRLKAEASFVFEPHSGTLPDPQDKIWDTLKQTYKNHTIRPESWVYGEIDGLPTSAYIADYDNEGKKMVEYCTYILNKQYLCMFELHVEKKAFDEIKPDFERMIQSFKWKNK